MIFITVYFSAGRRCPQVSIEEFSFLEKIFQKTKPEERTWAKLVNPKTIHWYYDGPEPTQEAIRYDEKVHRCKPVNVYLYNLFNRHVNNFIHHILQRWTTQRGEH